MEATPKEVMEKLGQSEREQNCAIPPKNPSCGQGATRTTKPTISGTVP